MNNEDKDKPRKSILQSLSLKRSKEYEKKKNSELNKNNNEEVPLELAPAMPELGTATCPVCGHRVTVFVTRTKRPFINCGFCSARIFYNGSRSMQLLQKQIKSTSESGGNGNSRVLSSLSLKIFAGGKR